MNLPPTPTKFSKFNNRLLQAARETYEKNMAKAIRESDIVLVVNGSWQKRGISKNGVVTVTGVDTVKVIDVQILSKHRICSSKINHLQNFKRNIDGYSVSASHWNENEGENSRTLKYTILCNKTHQYCALLYITQT
ncbi:uncharacterized protein NPIL_317161 [Nephila pilipes]|uniref:Uncharacterized protein n=1 Tax=Nephila pilipes TaxID=299642 RepID=A0A8X6IN37_NEPPI|nr:uncharacterized protein NPIL_317161 [Nephila pilipes]